MMAMEHFLLGGKIAVLVGVAWYGGQGWVDIVIIQVGTDRADRDGSEILLWTVRKGHHLQIHC